jgi:peptidyl-prolyl cis-trans isomerase-like 3
MANCGPNTNGSQFFITYSRCSKLNKKYTVFGRIIDGFNALDLMEQEPINESNDKPLNEIKIFKIIIHANPVAELEQI